MRRFRLGRGVSAYWSASVAAVGFERHVLRLCGLAACVLLLSFSAAPALAQNDRERGSRTTTDVPPAVERLWKEYPLNPTPASDPRSTTRPTRSLAPRTGSASADGKDGGFPVEPVALVFAGVALALLAVLASSALMLAPQPGYALQRSALHLPRLRRGGSRIAVRRPRRLLPAGWRSDDGGRMLLPDSLPARSDAMSKQPEQARPEAGTPEERAELAPESVDSESADYARLGEKVTAVLASAQEAAEQMVASARDEAERIRSGAEEQAAAWAAAAKSEAERLHRESETLRSEAEDYRKESRAAADGYAAGARAEAEAEAARQVSEADERAKAIVAEAEQRAHYVEQEEVWRHEALAAGAKRYEERLANLLEVFHGMAAQLEELLGTDRETENEPPDSNAEAPVDEGLEDALKPGARTQARST